MICNFRNQASKVAQCKVSIFSYSVTQPYEWVTKKASIVTLVALMAAGGGFWFTTEAIVPQIAQADSDRIEISLARQPKETYQELVNRAEAAALKSIQQSFAQDKQMTTVSIVIMGQNHGKIAPVLFLEVERSQWFSNPALQHWVTYFRSARSLLGFQDVVPTNATQRNISNPRPETITPTATTPNQAPTSNTGSGSQLPNTSTTTTPQPNVSPAIPPTSTSLDNVVDPIDAPVNNGTIINNPTNISVPNNSGLTPSNTLVPGVTRLKPNTSRNVTNSIPNATSPNQNVSPGTSPAGL